MPRWDEMLKVGLVQSRAGADADANLARTLARTREAVARGARLVCHQELFRTKYPCQQESPDAFDLAEPLPGPTTRALSDLASELGVVIVSSVFERRAAGLHHNSAVVIDADGALRGVYRKMHVPDDPLYYEKYYFAPGDTGFRAFDTKVGRVGVLVCWDQWYPEAARLTAMDGAELVVIPTAIGWHPDERVTHGDAQKEAWEVVQRGHAIANGLHVVVVNRVGHEGAADGGLDFWGGSFVADPMGRVLARASDCDEELLLVEVDRGATERVRRDWPFFRDRRIDAYGGLVQRWGGGD